MQVPLEISFREVEKNVEIEELIRRKAAKLEQVCDYISSCRVMVEKLQRHQRSGQPYRVRLDIKVPPGHELVISRDASKGNLHLDLGAEIRWAFDAAERQLIELMEKQRRNIKSHPYQQAQGVIERLYLTDGTGFIRTIDGREVFFHKNSVLHVPFEQLKTGMGVRFSEEMGEKGPQATSVQVVEIPESY